MEIGDRIHIFNQSKCLRPTWAKEHKNLKLSCSPLVHLPGAVFVDAFRQQRGWIL